jgi:hypothetical protein
MKPEKDRKISQPVHNDLESGEVGTGGHLVHFKNDVRHNIGRI